MSGSDEDVLTFIAASFPSVWALELLIALKREAGSLSRTDLVAMMRASDLVVSRAIDALVVAGLASVEEDQVVYLPASPAVADAVLRVEQLYRTRPDAVRRAIVAAGSSGATAFADAFKLRKDSDD